MDAYTLVAMDFDGNNDEMVLASALKRALLEVTETSFENHNGRIIPTYLYRINSAELRNTVAHGIACDHGFVCHIEPAE
jgi:hypothetical protein